MTSPSVTSTVISLHQSENQNSHSTSNNNNDAPVTDIGEEIFCGTIGGIMAKIVDYPADSVKVRYQSSTHASSCVTNCPKTYPSENVKFHHQMYIRQKKDNLTPLKVATRMWQREGFWGFYGGIASPLCGAAIVIAVAFLSFQKSKEVLTNMYRRRRQIKSNKEEGENNNIDGEQVDPMWLTTMAGILSGVARASVNTPIELLKTKVQVNPIICPSIPAAIRTTISSSPTWLAVPRYFYQGFFAMAAMSMIGNAFWFSTYELSLRFFQKRLGLENRSELPLQYFMCSASAGGVAFWTIIYPIDTVKTIIQKADKPGIKMFPTALDIVKNNPKSLFNGLGLTILRCLPANAAMIVGYEGSRGAYQYLMKG